MTNFIPIFPLEMVVFPGEALNLHIFEPRYKQLITECATQKKPFGIPVVIQNHIMDFGTLIYITEIAKTYDNGELDIRTSGDKIFRILEVIKEVPGKLYSGAIVNYPDYHLQGNEVVMKNLVASMKAFHRQLQLKKDFPKAEETLNAYDIAHFSGLTLQEEYQFMQLTTERQRQEYLRRHFENLLPAALELQQTKDKIQMNGHFQNLRGPINPV